MSGLLNTAIFDAPRPQWLGLVQEPIVDRDRVIIDAHHHLWGPSPSDYLADSYLADLQSGHNVVASVYVECKSRYRSDGPEVLRPLGEVEFAETVAEETAKGEGTQLCAAIVGFADLRALGDEAAGVLPGFVQAGRGRLKGIRNVTAWIDDAEAAPAMAGRYPGQLLDERFRRGFAHLAPMGLVFDAFLYHPQLPDLIDLAESFPDTTIVLDHLGGPLGRGRFGLDRAATFAEWRSSMLQLARCSNVRVKLGGLGMRISGFQHGERERPPSSGELAEAWRPFIETAIEAFGPQRCMFESNFPPDKGSFSYAVLWNAFKKLAQGCSEGEKDRLFSGTAAEVYDLRLSALPPVETGMPETGRRKI